MLIRNTGKIIGDGERLVQHGDGLGVCLDLVGVCGVSSDKLSEESESPPNSAPTCRGTESGRHDQCKYVGQHKLREESAGVACRQHLQIPRRSSSPTLSTPTCRGMSGASSDGMTIKFVRIWLKCNSLSTYFRRSVLMPRQTRYQRITDAMRYR